MAKVVLMQPQETQLDRLSVDEFLKYYGPGGGGPNVWHNNQEDSSNESTSLAQDCSVLLGLSALLQPKAYLGEAGEPKTVATLGGHAGASSADPTQLRPSWPSTPAATATYLAASRASPALVSQDGTQPLSPLTYLTEGLFGGTPSFGNGLHGEALHHPFAPFPKHQQLFAYNPPGMPLATHAAAVFPDTAPSQQNTINTIPPTYPSSSPGKGPGGSPHTSSGPTAIQLQPFKVIKGMKDRQTLAALNTCLKEGSAWPAAAPVSCDTQALDTQPAIVEVKEEPQPRPAPAAATRSNARRNRRR